MTSNNPLDTVEIHRIFADGERKVVELEGKLQAIIDRLVSIGPQLEDPHTCQCTLHLGRRGEEDVVKVDLQQRY